jgi:molecular chaperone DnaJ
MARPDFYIVLGVGRGETLEGIRAAYRELAKRHHPDLAGASTTARFQEIGEAYRTLSDPARRRAYDASLEEGIPPSRVADAPQPARAEPLDPFDPSSSFRPSLEALQQRFLRNFEPAWSPKAELVEGLNLEVVLSPEEAMRGVRVPIEIPTLQACEDCGGAGQVWLYPCPACRSSRAS